MLFAAKLLASNLLIISCVLLGKRFPSLASTNLLLLDGPFARPRR